MNKKNFYNNILKIALPVTVQSLLQALLNLIDGIMIGNLGSASIAGVGLGGKFISLFTVTMAAVVTVAGIMIAQYKGNQNNNGISNSFYCNLYFTLLIAGLFMVVSLVFPKQIMSLYTGDKVTINLAAIYLMIMTAGFIPQSVTLMLSALLRNMECARLPLAASFVSVITNTFLNYCFIFGAGVFPAMGVAGAALASSISRIIELIIVLALYFKVKNKKNIELTFQIKVERTFVVKIWTILAPILLCEFLWSLGENFYAMIYGHIGTEACAAMALTYPIQTIVFGILSGLSASAGIVVGKSLGEGSNEKAYMEAKEFIKITIIAAICISVIIMFLAGYYVRLFNVIADTRNIAVSILYAYSLVFCAKVTNMVLGGGILRSGGQTKYIMVIDIVGTWLIGVPLGFITAYILKLPIYYVYFILSLEEYVRLILEIRLFKSKRWLVNVTDN